MAASATVSAPRAPEGRTFFTRLRAGEETAYLFCLLTACSILLVTAYLIFQLWIQSSVARRQFGLGFLWTTIWDPNLGHFGALPFIYGTLVTSLLALIIAAPLGLGAAIYLSEMAPPKWSNVFTFLIELLAAVPSVIYGLLAIFTLVPLVRSVIGPALEHTFGFLPLFKGPIYGVGVLTAGMILAIMTFPYIISISRESLMSVPREQREAALALGATKWEATWDAVVPFARLGILGSIFLSLARALGETMAVTMVIGNDPKIRASLLAPGYTIASVIANEFTEATEDIHLASLVLLGLVLFLITIILNAGARLLILATTKAGMKK
ncbi:MAG TPA: phosphate ABC transporter permease subunit PstC [Bryobacteraceae bacterium]|jgi:phosphate transport system permease protein|nr:phosphate ABC transporter permease subunit PstC [Bryobacteraceae bacterium]